MNRTSLIEQAAKRLEELQRSGVSIAKRADGVTLRGGASAGDAVNPTPAGRAGLSERVQLHRGPQSGAAADTRQIEGSSGQHARTVKAATRRQSASVEIDLQRLARLGYLHPGEERSRLGSEFRLIKRPLLRNAVRDSNTAAPRNALIMVTSATVGEGKTFCSINLAMSIAMEVDTSVLLVDADVVRPAVLDRLGIPPKAGLLDILTGDASDLSDVILKTNVPKLSILPAGAPRAMATELLASAAMDEVLLDLATRYSDRVIVLDAPPLLSTTESPVLASRVGQVVIVVDAQRTPTHRVMQAFATVESCPVVLSLLNKCSEPVASDGYGYGY